MKAITIRISDSLREEMKLVKDINWSKEIRDSIEKRLKQEKMKNACEIQDRLRKKASGKWSGVSEIRKWREKKMMIVREKE